MASKKDEWMFNESSLFEKTTGSVFAGKVEFIQHLPSGIKKVNVFYMMIL